MLPNDVANSPISSLIPLGNFTSFPAITSFVTLFSSAMGFAICLDKRKDNTITITAIMMPNSRNLLPRAVKGEKTTSLLTE